MQYRNLGASNLKVSEAGLGCNNFGWFIEREMAAAVVGTALDLGVTLLDTADMYGGQGGSETMLGEILGARRKDVVLATKFGYPMSDDPQMRGASRRYVMAATEASLKRLKTDWIDLQQLHIPDPGTPMEETLRALEDLVTQGKVRHIGLCNMPAWQVVDTAWVARSNNLGPPISFQAEYSLVSRGAEAEVIPALTSQGIGFLPFFPLAGGFLTGKYSHGARPEGARLSSGTGIGAKFLSEANFARLDRLTAYAEGKGRTILELAFAWLLANPAVGSVIAGATSPAQVASNVAAGAWRLTPEEKAEVDDLSR